MGAVALGAILFGVLLLVAAAFVWQEASLAPDAETTYVIEEVVPFAYHLLSDQAMGHLYVDDVRRILEWEVRYLQGLASRGAGNGDAPRSVGPLVAGSDEGVTFIINRAAQHGHLYEAADVLEVLAGEAAYLVDIGAVGPPVTGELT